MTRLSTSPLKTDHSHDITLSQRDAATRTPGRVRPLDASQIKAVAGLATGQADFDQLLERMHDAFSKLALADDADDQSVTDTADKLASSVTNSTGSDRPASADDAARLAETLRSGLIDLPGPISDTAGQRLLRAL